MAGKLCYEDSDPIIGPGPRAAGYGSTDGDNRKPEPLDDRSGHMVAHDDPSASKARTTGGK